VTAPDGDARALLAELRDTRAAFERAEREARAFLAERSLEDQTQVDVEEALARYTGEAAPGS